MDEKRTPPAINNPIVCPITVGRQSHLDGMQRLLQTVLRGKGDILLLVGEAGVGKTRLLSEAAERAETLGFLILQANCFEPDQSLAYGPIRDLFAAPAGDDTFDTAITGLAQQMPELAKALPELAARTNTAGDGPFVQEPDKRRIFQALTDFLAGIAARRPVMLVVEDLHWADNETLEFLLHLARRAARLPLLLVLSYRPEDRQRGLLHLLASLDRERLASELRLDRLGLSDVDAMLRAIFGLSRSVRAESLNIIYALTEGNPFFVEEVLRSLVASAQIAPSLADAELKLTATMQVPRSVQEAVQGRMAQLSEGARLVLGAAAVTGRRFDFALLRAITGSSEFELIGQVKQLIEAELLVEEPNGSYAFRHALTRHAVYSDLLAVERRTLHAHVAATIERLGDDAVEAHIADLAYHYFEAEDWRNAASYSRRAADAAQAIYAPRIALEHFSRAIVAAERLAEPPPAALYRGRAAAYATLGETDLARDDQLEALRRARAARDQREEWQTLLDLGALWAESDYTRTRAYLTEALQLATVMNDRVVEASSLNRLGNWYANNEETEAALQCHEGALVIFRELGDQRGVAETLDLLGLTILLAGDLQRCRGFYDEAVRIYEEIGDRIGLASTLATLADSCMSPQSDASLPGVSYIESLAFAERSLQLARETGWRSGEAFALGRRATALAGLGDYAEALASQLDGLRVATEIEHEQWIAGAHIFLGALYTSMLALAPAREHLERGLSLARALGSSYWINSAKGMLGSVYVRQEALDDATILLGDEIGDTPAKTRGQRIILVARAELALALGRPRDALRLADLIPGRLGAGAAFRPLLLRGRALSLLGSWPDAEQSLAAARDIAQREGAGYALWEAHAALGDLLWRSSRRDEAARAFADCRRVLERQAARMPADFADSFVRLALAGVPVPAPRRRRSQAAGGLSQREWEIALRVAQGESNRSIAEALVLSERTVESHLSSLLRKLSLASRREVADWVRSLRQAAVEQP